ncbi:lycopene cyclase family protein [Phytohabitans suffuscus]|uniref:Lycopene cyclase n=1 Tax=Phytohabitans suffuscus TaxID=624315 RepID=A0A6F8YTV8_9ACTN|nr:lycopene cyclase family protein [Phytohabitans suffuscus]BCB89544.1 lycopene cyclase [Phytohabitans suffuscus]
MAAPELDAVIAGGGLSGLSLAAHLAAGPWRDRTVLMVDDETPAREPASGWGYWTGGAGLLDAAAVRSYTRVRVFAGGAGGVVPLGSYRYRVLRRTDLQRLVRSVMGGCPGFAFRHGRVESVRTRDGQAEVVVDGRAYRASWAFDSVTPPPPGPPPDGHLAFAGWEVRCAEPRWDPDTPVLFDFRVPQAGRSRFAYILPAEPDRALVELTEFTGRHTTPSTVDDLRAALAAYLRPTGRYEILRVESAVLPLRAAPAPRRSGHVLRIGARGGLLKATTGYGYQRIQRDSAAVAASLARHGHPFALPRARRRHRLLDAILLEVLDRDPAQLELAFRQLFLAGPAERVLRFLDERTRLVDEVRLAATLPPGPYLRATPAVLAALPPRDLRP